MKPVFREHGARISLALLLATAVAAFFVLRPGERGARAEIGAFRLASWQSDKGPGAISLADLDIKIEISGGFAQVRLTQYFENKTDAILEGTYYLKLPADATLMNFGVWDEGKFTEAVVIEREAGRRAYQEIVSRMVDPALMEAPEAEITDAFQVRVAPIPPRAVRRIESSFHLWLPVRRGKRVFILPLKPGPTLSAERAQRCKIDVTLRETSPLQAVAWSAPSSVKPEIGGTWPSLSDPPRDTETWTLKWEGGPLELDEDLTLQIPLDQSRSSMSVTVYRDADSRRLDVSATGGETYQDDSGYFLAEAFFSLEGEREAENQNAPEPARPARNVAILFDVSLSMGFDKLVKAVEVFDSVLADLSEKDRFAVITMGGEVKSWQKSLLGATAKNKSEAHEFLRRSPLAGGTRLAEGLAEALAALSDGSGREGRIVVISDGRPTMGEIVHAKLLEAAASANKTDAGFPAAGLYVFGVGEDANVPLLKELARQSKGYFIWARETESLESKLPPFLRALAGDPVKDVGLEVSPAAGVTMVYPADRQSAFDLESIHWSGKYANPEPQARFSASGTRDKETVIVENLASLPEKETENDFVARLWAQQRVEFLLEKIRREGETEEWIDEIVALSKRFKFPTPYTSYLVAPRAFLRPRVIRPADPVIKIKAPPDTAAVTALLPFGETRRMTRIGAGPEWETRFLVPLWMKDGQYFARIVLTDSSGKKTMEYKEFVVDGSPPRLKLRLPDEAPGPGRTLEIAVDADPDVRTINAKLGCLPAAPVKWDPEARINKGSILLPAGWPSGEYTLRITAEDFAHNVTSLSAKVTVGE